MTKQIDTDARITRIRLQEQGSNPASPAAGYQYLFVTTSGFYAKDSAGNVTGPFIDASDIPTVPSAAGTVTAETSYGASSSAGAAATFSRGDHTHGTPALGTATPADVATAGAAGTGSTPSKDDHAHRGVLSVAKSGAAALYGNVTLTGEGNIALTQTGQNIAISGTGSIGGGASALDDLTDVVLTSPADDQVLTFDSVTGKWVNQAAGAGTDGTAIHDDVGGEINAITEKASPVNADILLIEDSAASYAKKKVQVGNLPGGTGGDTFLVVQVFS